MSVKLAFHQISSMAIALCLGAIPPMQAADIAPLAQNASDRQVFAERCYRGVGLEALEACDRALEIDADDATTWTNRGTILEELGQIDRAIASHDRALVSDPDYSLALTNRCAALIASTRYDEALASCQAALAGDGRWGDEGAALAWYNAGLALDRLDRAAEAEGAYTRALELKPDYASAWNNLGLIWENTGRLEDALAAYERAANSEPGHEIARSNIDIVRNKLR